MHTGQRKITRKERTRTLNIIILGFDDVLHCDLLRQGIGNLVLLLRKDAFQLLSIHIGAQQGSYLKDEA